jgi:redox-sensitive bicupin YhaK (pirin superfamily)
VLRGNLNIDGHNLAASDGLAVTDESAVALRAADDAQVLLFDLA